MPTNLSSWLVKYVPHPEVLHRRSISRIAGASKTLETEAARAPRPVHRRRILHVVLAAGTLIVLGVLGFAEMQTSWLQARVLAHVARSVTFDLQEGPSREGSRDRVRLPADGPYDRRLGYASLPDVVAGLTADRSFEVAAQAVVSDGFEKAVGWGLFPIYRQKNQAGLEIRDRHDTLLYRVRYPERVYPTFEAIPPLVWQMLLYIENRELLDPRFPDRNPAVEWDRFGRALVDQGLQALGFDREGPGGSTLATQLEKFRHSPGGLTSTPREKLRQMASASLRSYLDGRNTLAARRLVVRDYLNTVPLAAIAGYGEVIGLGDGLWAWYNADFDDVNSLLGEVPSLDARHDPAAHAVALRQVLSLYLANRRPSYYLLRSDGQAELQQITDGYLRLMAADGLIAPSLRDAALAARPPLRAHVDAAPAASFVGRKAVNAVRTELLAHLQAPQLYDLDHYDLAVRTTIDREAQRDVATLLERLKDPAFVHAEGLVGARLLGLADPADVAYAVVLYEATPRGNLIRVQADNFEGPFNINEGAKLELGSTAKLRTLVHYLQIVAALHEQYVSLAPDALRAVPVHPDDRITAWAFDYLAGVRDRSLRAMLEAAMERRYSASPAERFYTGGGVHVFHNFAGAYGGSVLTVREGFRHSVNLVFIRLMRDVVRYHLARLPGDPAAMLADAQDPRRQVYLARFADREGRQFTYDFYERYAGRSEPDQWTAFVQAHRLTPRRLAWAYRSVHLEAGRDELAAFLDAYLPEHGLSESGIASLYERTDPRPFSWQDRGYLAGVHPLELWLLDHLGMHPTASWTEVADAGAAVRQEVYAWLFTARSVQDQNQRIRTLLEEEAFAGIHEAWARVGYPFDRLVPSYATAIGSSADRPNALAELMGIVVRGGLRYPAIRIERLHFGADTPYETVLRRPAPHPERVLAAEVAAVVRDALVDVVEQGTARRAYRAVLGPDGAPLVIGGKTGTGDNRTRIYGAGGQLLGAEPTSRTSTFVFFLGDRFFGTVTTYVAGSDATRYSFTSSLPAQLLKMMAPAFAPLLEAGPDETAAVNTPVLP